jgi:uncharacterized membrane protein YgdD (TMEM256/DUF423 family)
MFCPKSWMVTGAVFAGLAVGAGAFAAHGLDHYFHKTHYGEQYTKRITIDGQERTISTMPMAQKLLADVKTGAEYQMYHALALIGLGLVARGRQSKWFSAAAVLFVAGIIGFSGGLYVYTLAKGPSPFVSTIAVMIVPIGGLFFLAGWFCFAVGVRQSSPLAPQVDSSATDVP